MLLVNILHDKGEAVFTLSETASLQDAARELDQKKVGALVVLDAEGAISGLLSERDIVRAVARGGAAALASPVTGAMTRAVVFAEPGETVDEGLSRMTDRRFRHLPVVAEGRLVGIVSIGDLVKHKIEEATAEARAMYQYIAAG